MTEEWRSLKLEGPDETGVVRLLLNRPARSNALDSHLFEELPLAIAQLDASSSVRVIILAGSGKNFCSGIDLSTLARFDEEGSTSKSTRNDRHDGARTSLLNLHRVKRLQAAFTSLEDCRKPVIAAIHGACIGGGVDLITACDLRYCSSDSFFSVKEVDLAIVADLGTLQRLPLLVGHGHAMDLALTGRRLNASEAKAIGLVNDVFQSKDVMVEQVNALARNIAAKSPLAVIGTKRVLVKSRDLSVMDGLDYVATWNSGMLVSNDLKEAIQAQMEKRQPTFSKL
ncbi:hypothetical protein GOP47_0003563 [Adiantum capillus-veneris]|uniref:Uncharacterized protein n=1 Tax=Adiantum capillus-veneris TaxID=13818 RepID=A0A9D4VC69_ADICA|nr:hypothetical protein GOP47_0003563 [Adiantum capillus-veneris]